MTDNGHSWDPFVVLMIDVQRDFWPEDVSGASPDFEQNVTHLLQFCRREGLDIVHLRAGFRSDKADWMARYKLLDRIPCVEGTPGAGVLHFASELPDEPVLTKQTFDGFRNPDLESYLEENKKRYVLVAGLVTSVCVLLTAASAAQRGYLVAVVEDCCGDTPEAHRHTLERYPFIFGRCSVDELADKRDEWLAELERLAWTSG